VPPPGRRSTKLVYHGKFFDIVRDEVELPGGKTADLEVLRHPGASAVVPLHPDKTVTLIRQYRYAADGYILEVPAGKLDAGESPESCAHREVVEEAGVRAGSLHALGWMFTTPGFTDEKIHLFAATDLATAPQALDDDEVIDVVRMRLADALALCANGGIRDGKSLCCLFRTAQELEAGRLRV
jgi:ADP-ribose pyrophosphatase